MAPLDSSREHADPHAEARAPLLIDRQRVIHSAAFRRLQFKTQVFVAVEEDHYRTRMAHTLEVANFARWLAAELGLSADLAEVVALAHDLGHPPFGHAGERALDACLRSAGGFEHNAQTLRVIEYLEHPYPEFRGLNLTRAVRECLAKHATRFDHPGEHRLQDGRPPPAEGQVVALADWLTYLLHDVQDGLYAGLIEPEELLELPLWRAAYAGPRGPGAAWRAHVRGAIDRIQRAIVREVVELSRPADAPAVRLGDETRQRLTQLEQLLVARVYRHPQVQRMDAEGGATLTAVFHAYAGDTERLPPRFRARVPESGAARVAADYVAGMTDRFCRRECARLCPARVESGR